MACSEWMAWRDLSGGLSRQVSRKRYASARAEKRHVNLSKCLAAAEKMGILPIRTAAVGAEPVCVQACGRDLWRQNLRLGSRRLPNSGEARHAGFRNRDCLARRDPTGRR